MSPPHRPKRTKCCHSFVRLREILISYDENDEKNHRYTGIKDRRDTMMTKTKKKTTKKQNINEAAIYARVVVVSTRPVEVWASEKFFGTFYRLYIQYDYCVRVRILKSDRVFFFLHLSHDFGLVEKKTIKTKFFVSHGNNNSTIVFCAVPTTTSSRLIGPASSRARF